MDSNQCKAQGGQWKDNKCVIVAAKPKKAQFKLKGNKRRTIFASTGAVALLAMLFLNFVPISGAPIMQSIQRQDDFYIMESNFMVKGGIMNPMPTNIEEESELINWIIYNAYGIAILDAPLVFNQNGLNELAAMLSEANTQILSGEAGPYISGVLFSDDLINRIKANNFGLTDLMSIKNELMKSADVICNAYSQYLVANPTTDVEVIKELCDSKPADIFQFNLGKYTLSLNDFDWYEYTSVTYCPPPDTGLPCQVTNRTRQLVGTIKMSDIKLVITQKGGDIFIGLNDKGIEEMNRIEHKYDFSQYAYELEHKDALATFNGDAAGYAVMSNSQGVVDAGDGKIEETSRLDDLWYGFKEGKLVNPTFVTNFMLGALIVACIVGTFF